VASEFITEGFVIPVKSREFQKGFGDGILYLALLAFWILHIVLYFENKTSSLKYILFFKCCTLMLKFQKPSNPDCKD